MSSDEEDFQRSRSRRRAARMRHIQSQNDQLAVAMVLMEQESQEQGRKAGRVEDVTNRFEKASQPARMESPTPNPKQTCLKLQLKDTQQPIFVKGTWFDTRFDLSITDGQNAWICTASEDQVRDRATQWDQPVSEYIALAERYLGFQHPESVYAFADAGDGHKRLSWTFEKEGTKLEWRWKCQPSPDSKKTTAGVLDFLMDSNVELSEEVVRKTRSFERLKVEAEKCLAQSEKLTNEKIEFESAIYAKFLGVLNSKKAKLRDLRDKLSKQEISAKQPAEEEEESSDRTEPYVSGDEKSEEESLKDLPATSKDVPTTRSRGRGRKRATPK